MTHTANSMHEGLICWSIIFLDGHTGTDDVPAHLFSIYIELLKWWEPGLWCSSKIC
ncbi:hypothetical protein DFP97_10295 [Paenibacillus prosopidis]|uniref:Uncharacterized protein n=1 Tax=Paenibacillus prosopidis TaxID=630520 RepID=A0A368W568_9BACL|nr:hypothetical protein DFP97_10295 [Paenibacillus prosopidis]